MLLTLPLLLLSLSGPSLGEWVQLPSLTPNAEPVTSSKSGAEATPASNSSSSEPSVAEHFIGEMQIAHQRLRASLWPNKKEPHTPKDKLHYLTILRNHILNNIARSMYGLNAGDAREASKRQKRGTGWGSGDHTEIGFPSLEVALLTLAFLVFAVFLVNMVLVLFSNIFGTGTTTTTGTNALGRRKREADEKQQNEETVQVLQAIDDFPLRHRYETSQCYADPKIPCLSQEDSSIPQIAKFLLGLKI